MNSRQNSLFVFLAFVLVFFAAFGAKLFKKVDAGHVAVATVFGKLIEEPFREGLHIHPKYVIYKWHEFDVRERTHFERAKVPSQDQLQTDLELSVQWRVSETFAAQMLRETGNAERAIEVHMVPKVRSLLREQGKSIKRAEDFFLEETQEQLQSRLLEGLSEYLAPKGIEVSAVLIRDITLPQFIQGAIEKKKEREQEVEQQKAELERFRTEQQELLAKADAEREAAEQTAIKQKTLADAQAYEIEAINKAIANSPAYIQLKALETLGQMAKDPAAKIYFIDGSSPQPIPLMHLGGDIPNLGK